MQIFRNRAVAWVVYVVVAALSVALLGGAPLLRERQAAQSVFYHGENGDDLCIDYDLKIAVETAESLSSLCAANGVETSLADDAARVASQTGVSARYQAYQVMRRSFGDAAAALKAKSLPDDASDKLARLNAEFLSRENTIGHDAYNDRADAFNARIAAFPANLVSLLRGVRPLEAFR